MEDLPIARFFIETLIGEPIADLQVKPEEYRYKLPVQEKDLEDEAYRLLTIYKLDYVATIKAVDGKYKKVLIKVQKARNKVDVMRFRNYLAEQYKLEDEVMTENGKEMRPLPIITIYLLDFNLAHINAPAIKVERKYVDMIMGGYLPLENEFIEQLTHNSFIVQLLRIEGKLQTRLDQLLSVFEQRYFLNDNGTIKDYSYNIYSPEVKRILDKLHLEGVDPETRLKLEDEVEAWRLIEGGNRSQFDKLREESTENKKTIEEKEKTIEANKKALEEIEKARAKEKKLLEEKEKELEELRELLKKKNDLNIG